MKAPSASVRLDKPPRDKAAIGALAEEIAAQFLASAGLMILGKNVRVGRAEIDLLVRDGPVVVLVEVRTRGKTSYQRALDSIDKNKQARLRAAGQRLWRERFAKDASIERMRFDAISVAFEHGQAPRIEHIKAAF